MSGCGLGGRVLLNAPLRRHYSHARTRSAPREATVIRPPSGEDVANRQMGERRVSKARQSKKGPETIGLGPFSYCFVPAPRCFFVSVQWGSKNPVAHNKSEPGHPCPGR